MVKLSLFDCLKHKGDDLYSHPVRYDSIRVRSGRVMSTSRVQCPRHDPSVPVTQDLGEINWINIPSAGDGLLERDDQVPSEFLGASAFFFGSSPIKHAYGRH